VSYAPQSSSTPRGLPACATVILLLVPTSLYAQDQGEIATDTRLRKNPNGVPLVSLPAGAEVETRDARGDWHEVVVEGWIFTSSTDPTRRDGFDLVVSAPEGENIRESPNGEVVGRVRSGTLLRKLETRGGWTRVSRAGWVPRSAVSSDAEPADTPAVARPDSQTASAGASPVESPRPPAADVDRAAIARTTQVYASPQGGQYGTLQTGAPARVLGRSGEWVRVSVEGWVRDIDLQAATGGALTGVTAAEVRAEPARYVGKTVDWRLQLISVQTADELRTEMPRGQRYLLTRGPLPEAGFVYVTVSASQAMEFRSLPPLQELVLRVNIKAPRSKYLTTPVVEFVSRVTE